MISPRRPRTIDRWFSIAAFYLTCFWIIPQTYGADEYVIAKWGVEQGLPEDSIRALLQTRDGYLWMGTYNGLVRFDGLKFTTFNTANTPVMRAEDISGLFEDREGRLWVGTAHGLLKIEDGKFIDPPEAHALRDTELFDMQELADGSLMLATDHGVFRGTDKEFVQIPVPAAIWPTRRSRLALDLTGNLWVGHRSDLFAWKDGKLSLAAKLPSDVAFLSIDRDNTLWAGLANKDLVQIVNGVAVKRDPIPGVLKNNFFSAPNGDLWISTENGVYRQRGNHLLHLSKENGLPEDAVRMVQQDRESNLWVGTGGGGLVRLREKLLTTFTTQNGLSSDDVVSVMEDRSGKIWAGSFAGGLSGLENGQWHAVKPPGLPPDVQHVISVYQTRDDAIWLGTYGQGAFRWQNGELQQVTTVREAVSRAILEDRDGGMWIGSNKAGIEYHRGNVVRHYSTENGLTLNFVTSIAQDNQGRVWVGTEDGLNRIDDGKITQFYRKDGLGTSGINALYADKDGTLWIGTMGGGLSRFKDGRFTTITSAQGLAQDVVSQIVEDDSGQLWMGSRMGIFRASKEDLNRVADGEIRSVYCVSYTTKDGLVSLNCVGGFQPTCMKAKDGCLWFCGTGGLVVIDPKRTMQDPQSSPVFLESILVDGEKPFTPSSIKTAPSSTGPKRQPLRTAGTRDNGEKALVVHPGAQRLEFHFTGLHFTAPEQLQFRCKLENYDKDWQFVGTRRVAYYTRVPPGRYRFRVSTATAETEENAPEASLALIVQPHVYEQWWFRGLAFASIAGVLAFLYRLRILHLRQIERLRWRIASDLHDEVGSNLSNIALLAHLGRTQQSDSEQSKNEFTEINRVALETAYAVRDLVWFISPECETLEEMSRQMETIAGRFQASVPIHFIPQLTEGNLQLSLSFRRNLLFLYKEALHNAVKHAKASAIKVSLQQENGMVDLLVEDDGIGYDVASGRRGHGQASMRRRTQDLGGTLNIESRPGGGTRISLKAPIK